MRIAYLSIHWPRTLNSGVGRKIHQQVSFWRDQKNEVRFFMHTHDVDHATQADLLDGEVFYYNLRKGVAGLLSTEINRAHALDQAIDRIKSYQPDLIYIRWGMYAYPLHRLFTIAPTILEINTNDTQQHKLLGKYHEYYNLLTRSISLKRASGLVCVSQELAEIKVFSRFRIPTRVIANGFDTEQVKELPPPNNSAPNLVFIGSPGCPWHGVEKLAPFADTYPEIQIHLVGYDQLPGLDRVPANLHLHGYLKQAEYIKILGMADATIGSLGLHRINVYEASTLKTRECLSYGIPLILPYKDTDLDDIDSEHILKIPNCEDNLITHGNVVARFVEQMRGKRIQRDLVLPRIDAKTKETSRLEFFTEMVSRRKGTA
jgi:hypothetical protein